METETELIEAHKRAGQAYETHSASCARCAATDLLHRPLGERPKRCFKGSELVMACGKLRQRAYEAHCLACEQCRAVSYKRGRGGDLLPLPHSGGQLCSVGITLVCLGSIFPDIRKRQVAS